MRTKLVQTVNMLAVQTLEAGRVAYYAFSGVLAPTPVVILPWALFPDANLPDGVMEVRTTCQGR